MPATANVVVSSGCEKIEAFSATNGGSGGGGAGGGGRGAGVDTGGCMLDDDTELSPVADPPQPLNKKMTI